MEINEDERIVVMDRKMYVALMGAAKIGNYECPSDFFPSIEKHVHKFNPYLKKQKEEALERERRYYREQEKLYQKFFDDNKDKIVYYVNNPFYFPVKLILRLEGLNTYTCVLQEDIDFLFGTELKSGVKGVSRIFGFNELISALPEQVVPYRDKGYYVLPRMYQ